MPENLSSNSSNDKNKSNALTAYLIAIVFFFLTLSIKLILSIYSSEFQGIAYLLAFVAVVLTASYGGVTPGIFATILSSVASNDVFFGEANILKILAFLVDGFLISLLVGRIKDQQEMAVKKSEISIKNEQYLRGVLDSLFVFVGVTTVEGILLETNLASIKKADLSFKDVIGKNIINSYWWSYSEESKDKLSEAINQANKGIPVRYDTLMRIGDGELINVDFSLSPLNAKDGVKYLVLLAVDVNQRTEAFNENKRLYREIKKQKKVTDNIISNIPGIVWELSKKNGGDFRLNFVSDYAETLLGYKIGSCKDNPNFWKKIIYEDDRGRILKEIEQVYIKQKPQISQFRCLTNSGKLLWMDARFAANTDDEGKSIGVEGVLTNITDRIKLEQTKEEFVNIASHEIKTPLATIKAFAQIIETKLMALNNKEAILYLHKMDGHILRLNQIINDFMDFSKIQSGKMKFYQEEFKIYELLKEAIEDMNSVSKTHKIYLTGKVNGIVKGDRDRMYQVLINLISNAIKYSPDSDRVDIKITKEEDKILIEVTDFGIGIPWESQKKIFEKFYRVSNPKKRNIEGFGLGLYISSEIIKKHGGKIWLKSQLEKGSTFYVSLPLSIKTKNVSQKNFNNR